MFYLQIPGFVDTNTTGNSPSRVLQNIHFSRHKDGYKISQRLLNDPVCLLVELVSNSGLFVRSRLA